MNIIKLIGEIIPPSDYHHRNGFNNTQIIDKLTDNEKKQIEDILISKLLDKENKEIDTLIVATLAYLKSEKALPVLEELLRNCSSEIIRLEVSSSIFEINQNDDMVDIAIKSFRALDNESDSYYKYKLASAFFYLSKFNKLVVKDIIKEYINHKEYLVSCNAKRALDMQ